MSRKVILTCAVVGENQYNKAHPNFPITPQQIADAALEAEQAGASAVHLHVRNPETGAGSRDPDLFLDMATRVRDNGVKAVMNITCGGGAMFYPDPEDESRGGPGNDVVSAEERYKHIDMCMPEVCSLDVTTQNQQDGDKAYVYLNTEYTLRKMAKRFQELGVNRKLKSSPPAISCWPTKCWKRDCLMHRRPTRLSLAPAGFALISRNPDLHEKPVAEKCRLGRLWYCPNANAHCRPGHPIGG